MTALMVSINGVHEWMPLMALRISNVGIPFTHTDTQTHRHTDTQTHRHTDTQTHRHTDTQTHRNTDNLNFFLSD